MLSLLAANGKPDKPWANHGKALNDRIGTTGQRRDNRGTDGLVHTGRAPHGRTRVDPPDPSLAAIPPDA